MLPPRAFPSPQGTRSCAEAFGWALWLPWQKGWVILEHSAPPRSPDRPSIWRTALIQHLLDRGYFQLFDLQQFQFGASTCKPATFLCGNLDAYALTQMARRDAVRPQATLLGINQLGEFKTFSANEYPAGLNLALACRLLNRAAYRNDSRPAPARWPLACGFAASSSQYGTATLADFQGQATDVK